MRLGTLSFHLSGSTVYLANTAAHDLTFIAYDETMEQTPQQDWLKEQAGAGVAALPCFLGRHYDRQAMDTVGADLERDVWLVVHSDMRYTPGRPGGDEFSRVLL